MKTLTKLFCLVFLFTVACTSSYTNPPLEEHYVAPSTEGNAVDSRAIMKEKPAESIPSSEDGAVFKGFSANCSYTDGGEQVPQGDPRFNDCMRHQENERKKKLKEQK